MADIEKPVFIPGPCGQLEGLYLENTLSRGVALICHPHPQYAGTMHNKVVSTLQRAARDAGYSTLRFNFRGVGQSAGVYGDGYGEITDAEAAAGWLLARHPEPALTLMGFSFGACVAACLAGNLYERGCHQARLFMVAPAVERFDVGDSPPSGTGLTIIQPDADEVVNPERVYQWSRTLGYPHELIKVAECSHFFHGRLTELKALMSARL